MIFKPLPLKGAYQIELEKRGDERGFFARYWCKNEFEKLGLNTDIFQINNSLSMQKGTLRGLHFQYPPAAETKIIRCITGAIWDVMVDIRQDSPTFGKWYGAELNEENRSMLYVPKGFAHGFVTLTEQSEIIYLVSEFYSPLNEDCLRWDDQQVNIKWPVIPTIISEKDQKGVSLNNLKPINI